MEKIFFLVYYKTTFGKYDFEEKNKTSNCTSYCNVLNTENQQDSLS